jgi:hypothetical protein
LFFFLALLLNFRLHANGGPDFRANAVLPAEFSYLVTVCVCFALRFIFCPFYYFTLLFWFNERYFFYDTSIMVSWWPETQLEWAFFAATAAQGVVNATIQMYV